MRTIMLSLYMSATREVFVNKSLGSRETDVDMMMFKRPTTEIR